MKSKRSSLKFAVNSLRNESTKGSQKFQGVGPHRANPVFSLVSILVSISQIFSPARALNSSLLTVLYRLKTFMVLWPLAAMMRKKSWP